jgi:cytochrome c biogenesis protein CcdA
MLLFTLSVALPPSAIAQGISEAGSVVVYFFGDAECAACKRTITFVEEVIGRFNGSAVLRVFEVRYNETSRQVFMRFCSAFSLSDVQLPVVFIGEQCLHGEAETREHLAEVIDEYTAGGLTYEDTWSYVERTRESQQLAISLPVVMAAAVVDSVNPCAIGVALLLLCFAELAGSRRRLIEVGMTYVIAVYLTYFSLGLGLISVISLSGLAYWFAKIMGAVAIIVGLIDIKDWVKEEDFCVNIPAKFRPTVMSVAVKASLPACFVMGSLVALIELPCTGAVYISITSMLAKSELPSVGLLYLAIYNLVFVLPLVVIVLAVYAGIPWVEIEKQKERRRNLLNLVSGTVLILLGTAMLAEII